MDIDIPDAPDIDTVRALAERCSNWGRWGPDDQLGTLNHIRPEDIVAAAGLVRTGRVISLAIPVDEAGPQTGGFGRFNPIHLMIRDGNGAMTGTTVRDFYGGRDRYIRGTDDLLILPLQSGTQWDALAHIIFDGKIYNGYDATSVGSRGAIINDIAIARDKIVGRGVLLDVPRSKGRPWLEPGEPIHAEDLEACARAQGVEVGRGDIVLIRTGQIGAVSRRRDVGRLCGRVGPRPRPRHADLDLRPRHRRDRHGHVGHGGPAQRDPGRLPAPAHHPDRARRPDGRRDLRPRGAGRRLRERRRLRVPVHGPAAADHGRGRLAGESDRHPVTRG